MKKSIYILTLLVLSITLAQCCKKKSAAQTNVVTQDTEVPALVEELEEKVRQPIAVTVVENYEQKTTDSFTIVSTEMKGDSLALTIQYGGGCRFHEFVAFTDKKFMKSMPPQINLYVEHNANGDNCRALITETLYFLVTDLQYAGSKEVKVIVNGNREKMVSYQY